MLTEKLNFMTIKLVIWNVKFFLFINFLYLASISSNNASFYYFDYDENMDEIIISTIVSGTKYLYIYPINELKTNQSVKQIFNSLF